MAQITLREINRLAIPAILAGIAEPLIGLADTAIIGQLGEVAQGGVGIATSFFSFMIWLLLQTESAVTAIVAKYYGKNQLEGIAKLVPQTLFLNLLLGGICLGAFYPLAAQVFSLYNAEGALLDTAVEYFHIRAFGFPIALCTLAIFGVFRGIQNTAWAMRISLVGGGVNIVLDFALVYGIPDLIPAMGVKGAALASVCAQAVMLVLSLWFLHRKTDFPLIPGFSIHPELKNILGMSANLFIRVIALNLAFFLANRYAAGYGNDEIAAHAIAINIWLFSAYFIDGYSNAGHALSGRLLGAGNPKELYRVGIQLLKINILIGALLALAYLITYPFMGALFSPKPMVIALFNGVFWILIISQPINGIAFTFDGVFKGLGETEKLRNSQLVATFLGFVPVLLLFDYWQPGLQGVWWAFFAFMVFRGIPLWYWFVRDFKPGGQTTNKSSD